DRSALSTETARPIHTAVAISPANTNSPPRRTRGGVGSVKSAAKNTIIEKIAATTAIVLLSRCSCSPIAPALEASSILHSGSKCSAHPMFHTVLSKAVPTAKIPSSDHPTVLHRLFFITVRPMTTATITTIAVSRSPQRNHAPYGWSNAASSLMNKSGSASRLKTISSSQLEYSTAPAKRQTTDTQRRADDSDRCSRVGFATASDA